MSMATNKLVKVFVYGTLKRGEPNHHWLTKVENGFASYLGTAKTQEKFPLVIATRFNIPFLLDKKGVGHQIHGEVYEVDDTMLTNLDVLEDYPTFYDREVQQVIAGDDLMPCWLYLIRKFPEHLLQKQYLESYNNSAELLYCESIDEIIEDDDIIAAKNNKSPETTDDAKS